jgi:AraC-like DNA-binding protein
MGAGRAWIVEDAALALERPAENSSDTLKLVLQSRGNARLKHAGQRVSLGAGDLTLVDGRLPFRLELEPSYRQSLVELPRSLVSRRHRWLLGRVGEAWSRAEPAHAHLFESLEAIVKRLAGLSEAQRAPLLEAVLSLLASTHEPATGESRSEWRYARACADLEANLANPDLTAALLAELQATSRRHLDAIFSLRGMSIERRIWDLRLLRIAEQLVDPRHAQRPLIDLALSWGFNSHAHFTRAFRRKFGMAPSAFRTRAVLPPL